MASVKKQYYLIIGKHGKNRYKLETYEGKQLISSQSFNDMTQCELAKIVVEHNGYKHAGTTRA